MELCLKGVPYAKIAQRLGRSYHTVNNWFRGDPLFRVEYQRRVALATTLRRDVERVGGKQAALALIEENLKRAAEMLVELLNNTTSEARKVEIIEMMFKIAGLTQSGGSNVLIQINPGQVRWLEAGMKEPDALDVDYEKTEAGTAGSAEGAVEVSGKGAA